MGGSVGTAAIITSSATAVIGALGSAIGAKFDDCETDEERLKVIQEKILKLEAELSIQPLNPYLKINLRNILVPAILLLLNMKTQD